MKALGRAGTLFCAGALALTGCSPAAPSASPATSEGAIEPSAQPRGELVVAVNTNPTTLDVTMSGDQPTADMLASVYEGLTARAPGTMQAEPHLAESFERVDDTTWEFNLREGVTFHNGEAFDAESVKFTLDRTLDPDQAAPGRGQVAVITEVQVVDSHTVRIITDGPVPTLPARLTHQAVQMLPKAYVEEMGDEHVASNPVGTGPYQFVEWVPDERLVLEAYDEYWGGPPSLARVTFLPTPEASTRVAALQTGSAHLATNVPPDQAQALEDGGEIRIETVPSAFLIFFGFNELTPGPLQDVRVRRAINHAVDRNAIVDQILQGYGRVAAGVLSEEVFSYDSTLEPYEFDPDTARSLLAEAGFGDGFDLTINAPSGRYLADRDIAQAVQGYLGDVGINVELGIHEFGTYATNLRYGMDEPGAMYMLGWGGSGTFVPELHFIPTLTTGQGFSTIADAELDELVATGGRTLDDAARSDFFQDAQRRAYEEAHRLFLHQQNYIYGVLPAVGGWEPRPDSLLLLHDVTVE